MRIASLCYHDVVDAAAPDSSGFPGVESAGYKLDPGEFERHLEAIGKRLPGGPTILEWLNGARPGSGCLLTFDDGGASAYTAIAPMLERFGFRGHFFIVTDYIDAPGFLTSAQIRDLRRRGHVIGSHSRSHRGRMSSFTRERLREEWGASLRILSQLLGEAVTTAAVPSGYYSRAVAEAAAAVGCKALFTLEPTAQAQDVAGCLVLGRYLIKRDTAAEAAGGLAAGSAVPRAAQWLLWNAKKAAKAGLRGVYPKVRRAYLSWQRPAP